MKVLAIFTCFNRKEKTKKCIETITFGNPECDFTFVVADDGSTDGTGDMLRSLRYEYNIYVVNGSGNWFYSGGMNAGMEYALQNLSQDYDYMLMLNDDVEFIQCGIQNMINQSKEQKNAVIVGAMRNDSGIMSYSAIKYTSSYKYRKMDITEWENPADTFNANCVLIPYNVFLMTGAIDKHYSHSLGDFDYGLEIKRQGQLIYVSRDYVGICNNNSNKNTWIDVSLSRKERLKKKESVKGAPAKQWFYFLMKNFGIVAALKGSITPYLRILLKK